MTLLADFGFASQRFTSITADSRQVRPGSLFLAYPGAQHDGRDYIAHAIHSGASAVVFEQQDFSWDAQWSVPHAAVGQLKNQVGEIAAEYYQQPTKNLTMIGVTGTNGKTSVSQWLAQCLAILGKKPAVVGTIGNGLVTAQSSTLMEAGNTTPDAILLQALLADFLQQGADAVAMEVSSHGLDQGRVNGVEFDIAVLTNLTRDHLDYHGTMQAYAMAKQKLLTWDGLRMAILNAEDAFGTDMADMLKRQHKPHMTYGMVSADVQGSHLELHQQGLSMQVNTPQGRALLYAPVLGRFNAYNVLAVLATLLALEFSLESAITAIAQIKPVLGRMQQLGGKTLPLVVIDYAHTPDALEKVLTTLREQVRGKLICVFGCGGDRDAGKRPLMGAVASRLADVVIVTSDNPRNEDPNQIISAVVSEMTAGHQVIVERAQAIHQAVQWAQPQDIVLVAGKGHEDYQEISGIRTHFNDAEVASSALSQYAKNRMAVTQ